MAVKPSRDRPIKACTSALKPVWTSYTTVLDRVLADWREYRLMSATSRRSNRAVRRRSMPSLAMRASAYAPQNWAMPRTRKTPINATGTIQRLRDPSVKPLSSSGLSNAGIRGSVDAPMRVATMAIVQPSRWFPKYGSSRLNRARRDRDCVEPGKLVCAAL